MNDISVSIAHTHCCCLLYKTKIWRSISKFGFSMLYWIIQCEKTVTQTGCPANSMLCASPTRPPSSLSRVPQTPHRDTFRSHTLSRGGRRPGHRALHVLVEQSEYARHARERRSQRPGKDFAIFHQCLETQ